MASPPAIPSHVSSYNEVPARLRPLYGPAPDGEPDGVQLTPPGKALSAYRSARAKDPNGEPLTPLRTLTKTEWQTLVTVAEPGDERAHFLRAAATRRITVTKD